MRKKLLSILLVLSLMLALVPAAFATDAVRAELEIDGTTLAFYGSGTATADCWNGDWTAVTHIALGYEIRGVAEDVLARCVNLVSFETIKGLQTYNGGLISMDGRQMLAAPNRCTAYEIPDLVQTVKTGAFRYCQGLTAVTFPASLTTIEAQTFTSCLSLTAAALPDGLKTIGDFAFAGCAALTSVLIPKSVTSIGAGAFTGCTALTAIDYSGTEAEWAQLTKGENALPEGVTVNFNAPIHLRFLDGHGSELHDRGSAHPHLHRRRLRSHGGNDTPRLRPLLEHRPCDDAADGDHDRRAHLYLQELRLQCHAYRGDPQASPAGARERAL